MVHDFTPYLGRFKVLVEVPLKLKRVDRVDPAEQPQLQRIAGCPNARVLA